MAVEKILQEVSSRCDDILNGVSNDIIDIQWKDLKEIFATINKAFRLTKLKAIVEEIYLRQPQAVIAWDIQKHDGSKILYTTDDETLSVVLNATGGVRLFVFGFERYFKYDISPNPAHRSQDLERCLFHIQKHLAYELVESPDSYRMSEERVYNMLANSDTTEIIVSKDGCEVDLTDLSWEELFNKDDIKMMAIYRGKLKPDWAGNPVKDFNQLKRYAYIVSYDRSGKYCSFVKHQNKKDSLA